MFCPYFTITDGESKKTSGGYNVPWQSIVNNVNIIHRTKPINPYRDFMAGGTTLGWKGKNYWVSDSRLIGKILRKIYGQKN